MAALSLEEARGHLDRYELTAENAFDVLGAIGRAIARGGTHEAREALIRVLDQREVIPPALTGILQGLIREYGLFPYLSNLEALSLSERLAYETHRPDGRLGEELVFHSEQSLVYERLMNGENVILSAPTSFGKSKVVDAYLDAKDFTNAVVIVPTIALMDETRRRMVALAGPGGYKLITHVSQDLADRNLLVMTQERLLEFPELPPIDFFVIDEFYKLDPSHSHDAGQSRRASQLNVAFDRLRRTGAQFYLLGPNITGLDPASDSTMRLEFNATFIHTDFTTVATDVERINVSNKNDIPDALGDVCRQVGPGTIIFCSSPTKTRKVADWLIERGIGFASTTETDLGTEATFTHLTENAITAGRGVKGVADAADWIGQTYHPDWVVTRALRAGIGIHHGRLPRALGHHMVRLFNEGRLPYLLVTSTLIEGVNTTARNVVILDHLIARKKYDYFTFSNIRGRSGRMFRHFVGKVVVFNPEPRRADLTIEIPVISQSANAAPEVLIHLPEAELTAASKARLAPFLDQTLITPETLRKNRGVALVTQVATAQTVAQDPARWQSALKWNGAYPSTQQVRELGRLLVDITGKSGAVRSGDQLGARINLMRRNNGDLAVMVQSDIEYGKSVDDAMDDNLEFVRNYAQFLIPTALSAAANIGQDVLGNAGDVTSPAAFAGELENLFQPPFAAVLEEFGIPVRLSVKLSQALHLEDAENLDDVLDHLRRTDPDQVNLHPFEGEMLRDTQASL